MLLAKFGPIRGKLRFGINPGLVDLQVPLKIGRGEGASIGCDSIDVCLSRAWFNELIKTIHCVTLPKLVQQGFKIALNLLPNIRIEAQ